MNEYGDGAKVAVKDKADGEPVVETADEYGLVEADPSDTIPRPPDVHQNPLVSEVLEEVKETVEAAVEAANKAVEEVADNA